jgi:hypothetical protein
MLIVGGLDIHRKPPADDMSAHIRQALTNTEARGRLLLTQDPTLRSLTHHQARPASARLDRSTGGAGG